MKRLCTRLTSLRVSDSGNTIIEFALIAPALMMALLGLMDFAYRSYVASVVEGTVHRAARLATVGNKTSAQIDSWVQAQLAPFSSGGTVTIDKTNYYQFSNIHNKEKIIPNSYDNGDDVLDSKECFQDLNNNGNRDDVAARTGLGGSDDIVYYTVSLIYHSAIPLNGWFNWTAYQTISATTVMRNQPYASQVEPPLVCAP